MVSPLLMMAATVAFTSPASIQVPVVKEAPPVDGSLSAAVWQQASTAMLTYDLHSRSEAGEPTKVFLLSDGTALYVGFDVTQTKAAILANQTTNNVGQDTDDEVQVNLWPGGTNSVAYQFIATARGTRYQNSTENANYEPTWQAAGKIVDGTHFTVTMRIPLSVMRGAQRGKWLAQLSRFEPTTGSLYLYNGNSTTGGTGDVSSAKPLLGMPTMLSRPQPRFATYALAALAAPSAGGNTSRVGVDFAVPITAGTSFVGTLHPDFSNVESDQQSITPTAFPRFLQETRPFFAQGSQNYNWYECDECLNISNLYTPNIPTPQSGYAIEGKEGRYTFGSFDAIGQQGRDDNAQSIYYRIPNQEFISFQRVGVTMPGFSDSSMFASAKWTDFHKFIFANYGSESGTNVTDPSKAKMEMIGAGFMGPNSFIGGNLVKMGSQYNPYDGLVSFNDAAGYGIYHQQNWNPIGGKIKNVNINQWIDRYHGSNGAYDNTDQELGFSVTTRSTWRLSSQTGASYALIGNVFTPLTQNQTTLAWHYGTATPTSLSFATGIFGNGRLNSWYRSTTFKVARNVALNLELDSTQQFIRGGPANVQWLERVGVSMQNGPDSSFAIGLRRFQGYAPAPSGGACAGICSNVTFNYHKKFGKRELYIAYGDPSQLITTPQFIVKLIDYIGADKGT